jgi:hypothetical protein
VPDVQRKMGRQYELQMLNAQGRAIQAPGATDARR